MMRKPAAMRWAIALNDLVTIAPFSPARIDVAEGQLPSDELFRSTSRKKAQTEIDSLVKLTDALIANVKNMHSPAIDALAEQGIFRHSVIAFAHSVGTAARRADLGAIPEKVSRGDVAKVRYAMAVTRLLRRQYSMLTRRNPTVIVRDGKDYGPFLDLVRAVFAVLEIKVSPEARARAAIKEKRGGQRVS